MKAYFTEIPQISQAFTQIDARTTGSTIYWKGEAHKVEWITPFSREANGWELNVTLMGVRVNVKAVGLDVFVNGEHLSVGDTLFLKDYIWNLVCDAIC